MTKAALALTRPVMVSLLAVVAPTGSDANALTVGEGLEVATLGMLFMILVPPEPMFRVVGKNSGRAMLSLAAEVGLCGTLASFESVRSFDAAGNSVAISFAVEFAAEWLEKVRSVVCALRSTTDVVTTLFTLCVGVPVAANAVVPDTSNSVPNVDVSWAIDVPMVVVLAAEIATCAEVDVVVVEAVDTAVVCVLVAVLDGVAVAVDEAVDEAVVVPVFVAVAVMVVLRVVVAVAVAVVVPVVVMVVVVVAVAVAVVVIVVLGVVLLVAVAVVVAVALAVVVAVIVNVSVAVLVSEAVLVVVCVDVCVLVVVVVVVVHKPCHLRAYPASWNAEHCFQDTLLAIARLVQSRKDVVLANISPITTTLRGDQPAIDWSNE